MNTTSLQEEQIFKSYKTLCEVLEETPKKTKEKKDRHYEIFRQYFDFEHISTQKIKILKVHKRGNFKNTYTTRSKYVNELSIILLNELNKNGGELFVTMKELMEIFGMITDVYGCTSVKKDVVDTLSSNPKKDIVCVNSICYQMNHKLTDMINRCLERLKKQNIIDYTKVTYVITDNGKEIANETVETLVQEIELEILKEYNCNSLQQIIIKGKHKGFYNRVREMLKTKYNIHNYFKVVKIKIVCISDNVPQYSTEELEQAKNKLQAITFDNVNSFLIARKKNYEDKRKEYKGIIPPNAEYPENYEEYVRVLMDKFIKSPVGCQIGVSIAEI